MHYSRRHILFSAIGALGGMLAGVGLPGAHTNDEHASPQAVGALIPAFAGSSEFQGRLAKLSKDAVLTQLHLGIVGTKPSASALQSLRSASGWEAAARQLIANPAFQKASPREVIPATMSTGGVETAGMGMLADAAKVRRLFLGFLGREPDHWELGLSMTELASLESEHGSLAADTSYQATGTTLVPSIDRATSDAGPAGKWTAAPVRWIR